MTDTATKTKETKEAGETKVAKDAKEAKETKESAAARRSGDVYVTPITHTPLPRQLVDGAFWGGLAGAVALGLVDPPLGLLLGAGVIIARHRSPNGQKT